MSTDALIGKREALEHRAHSHTPFYIVWGTLLAITAVEVLLAYQRLQPLRMLSILLALQHAGDLCVSDLAVAVGMSDSAVSHALRLLRAHGMVSAHREGRLVRYRVTGELTTRLLDVVSDRVVGDVALHAHGTTHR